MATRVTDLRIAQGDYKALDDRMLVLDFQAGHPQAFVEIHRRYSGLARHVCQRFLPNAHDADEALQETMIRVFQGLYRFNGRYALQPWIGRIATNVSLDTIRTRTRRPLVDDESLDRFERVDPADGPEEAVERLIERDLVLSVLSGLPETHRTALVLRELEGRSHREIAEVMEMSPAQAKALIHRAKGSFRRRWLLAVIEKGGLTGIAVLPLLWLLQAAHVARRVAGRVGHAGQVAQVATPEIVSTAVSSPVIAAAAGSGFGERVVAAGVTLLVAGSVTVGAATIARDRGDRADRAEAPSAVIQTAPPVLPELESPRPRERELVVKDDEGIRVAPVVVAPTPTVVPSPEPTEVPLPSPSDVPSPDPTPEPTIEPTPEPPPPPPPAPAWTGSLGIGWPSDDLCSCGPGIALVSTTSKGDLLAPQGSLLVEQTLRGAATDAEGDPAWLISAQVKADLTRAGGSLVLFFTLEYQGAELRFVATAPVVDVAGDLAKGDPAAYTFAGDYSLAGAGSETSPIKASGSFWAKLAVWSDGATPFLTQLTLIP